MNISSSSQEVHIDIDRQKTVERTVPRVLKNKKWHFRCNSLTYEMPRRNSRSSVIGLSRKHQSELVSGLRELRHSIDKVNAANLQCKPTLESLNQMHAKIVAADGCKTVTTSQVSEFGDC